MSMIATPSIWNAVETPMRGLKRSIAHSRTTSGSSPSNSTDSSPASRSSSSSTDICLPPHELCQLVVRCAVAPRAEALAGRAPVDPARDEPDHGLVQLLRRNSAENRPRDRRGPVEAAAEVDVVGLPAPALRVAHRRPLEADVADPMVRARVRTAVEVHAQPFDRGAEARLVQLDAPVHARLRLCDRAGAMWDVYVGV